MSSDDRIARLEQRVAVLEGVVRTVLARPAAEGERVVNAPAARSTSSTSPVAPTPPPSGSAAPPRPSLRSGPAIPLPEVWFGQRGLLSVGVTALILAAGYLLKLSFDRGWISPVARCIGGALAGVVVGGIGWRLQPRYRTYGAALIGCGAAIIYLSTWAASRLYGVLPPMNGIAALALVSVALAMIAAAIDVEALGATAALGAFFAPVLLGQESAEADLLLLYLASMAVGLGLVAARRRWRLASFVVAASYFGLGAAGAAERAAPWGVLLYGVLGGSAGLYLGFRERWWETRFLAFAGGCLFLVAANDRLGPEWPILLGAIVLAAPVWWHALRSDARWPLQAPPTEALYFFLTPLLLAWAVHEVAPRRFDELPGLVSLIVAIPYLAAGYLRPRPGFALIGAAALGLAAWQHWDGVARIWPLLGLVVVWVALDHRLARTDGRWYALATLVAALGRLFGDTLAERTVADAAFVGPWAVALWAATAVTAALAAGLWRVPADSPFLRIRPGLWVAAGLMLLFGVTGEIRRYFLHRLTSPETASLASGLAVSAWWLVAAAILVVLGLRRSLRPVQLAGFAVVGLAVVKVLVFDLSSLDALYRVGSVFLLGLVSLSLAYLYHRAYISRP